MVSGEQLPDRHSRDEDGCGDPAANDPAECVGFPALEVGNRKEREKAEADGKHTSEGVCLVASPDDTEKSPYEPHATKVEVVAHVSVARPGESWEQRQRSESDDHHRDAVWKEVHPERFDAAEVRAERRQDRKKEQTGSREGADLVLIGC